jgi:hypothetical protein
MSRLLCWESVQCPRRTGNELKMNVFLFETKRKIIIGAPTPYIIVIKR